MRRRMLLTGFGPFGKAEVNPTGLLMERIAALAEPFPDVETRAVVLDVDYVRAGEQFLQALESCRPAAVISFGLDMRTDQVRLERIAVNVDDAALADTGGTRRSGQRIVEDGPVGYWSTLPLAEMYQALQAAGLPVVMSNHAGAYLCNHLFYLARHCLEVSEPTVPMGFVHVPPLPEQVVGQEGRQGMALETLWRVAEVCVEVVARHIR